MERARAEPWASLALWSTLGKVCFRHRNRLAPIALVGLALVSSRGLFLVAPEVNGLATALGLALVVIGLGLRVAVIGTVDIRRSGARRRIAAPRLHRDGPYARCRHPLYLANAVILGGLTIIHDSPWTLGVALPTALAALGCMIAAEERLLAERFGVVYARYAAYAQRFSTTGLLRGLVGGAWSWRRALRKEHGPVFAAASAIVVLQLAEHVARRGVVTTDEPPLGLAAAWLGLTALYLVVRAVKHAGILTGPQRTGGALPLDVAR